MAIGNPKTGLHQADKTLTLFPIKPETKWIKFRDHNPF